MNFSSFLKTTPAVLLVSLVNLMAISQLSNAQSRVKFSPPTPPDPGTPKDRGQGAGRRGPCSDKYAEMTALVPSPRPNLPDDRWGLTVSDHPTIWFNVPTGVDAGTLVEWKLRDNKGKVIYKTSSQLSKTAPGVIGFSVPATTTLAIATYQWDLAIYCDSANRPNNADVTFDQPAVRKGRIQRLAAPQGLQQELAKAKTPLEQANSYAKYGVWYDAITTLGTQMRSAPTQDKTLLAAWRDLLQQQKLEGKGSATVTSCCSL